MKGESVVWKFCTSLGKDESSGNSASASSSTNNPANLVHLVRCDICKAVFKQHRGNTSSLLKHLKGQRSKQFYAVVGPTGAVKTKAASTESTTSSVSATTLRKLTKFSHSASTAVTGAPKPSTSRTSRVLFLTIK